MEFRTEQLDEFVAETDRRGGPGNPACNEYWAGRVYRPHFQPDQSLDPFGEAYVEQQLALYAEISGRAFNQLENEFTPLDVDRHVNAVNPYDHPSPGELALHVERLTRAIHAANPPRGSRFLDMGCGWGLSSEVAAYCGLDVTAIDVNPDFVALVNRRAERGGRKIAARQEAFDSFEEPGRFTTILFYECLHHALRPWDLIARMARHLEPRGRIILAGEPINGLWWKTWGLRLDLMSVYCIRKFGWFESGWTAEFLVRCFERARLSAQVSGSSDGVGFTVVAAPVQLGHIGATEIGGAWQHRGWTVEAGYMTSSGESDLSLTFPEASATVSLGLQNFRAKPIHLSIANDAGVVVDRDLLPGRNEIAIDRPAATGRLRFTADTWVPHEEAGTGDTRTISFHLQDATFV